MDASTDCDDADATVWRVDTSSSSVTLTTDAEVAAYCTSYCSRKPSTLTLTGVSTECTSLRSLDGLDGLTIGCAPGLADSDDLFYRMSCTGTSGLSALDGLESMTWVGRLDILNNRNLSTADAGALVAEIERVGATTVPGNKP